MVSSSGSSSGSSSNTAIAMHSTDNTTTNITTVEHLPTATTHDDNSVDKVFEGQDVTGVVIALGGKTKVGTFGPVQVVVFHCPSWTVEVVAAA